MDMPSVRGRELDVRALLVGGGEALAVGVHGLEHVVDELGVEPWRCTASMDLTETVMTSASTPL